MSSSQQAQRQKQFDVNREELNKNNNSEDSSKQQIKTGASPTQGKLQASMERLQMQPNVSRRAAGSNWLAVAAGAGASAASGTENQEEPTAAAAEAEAVLDGSDAAAPLTKSARNRLKRKAQRNRYVAMDCEMVGVGHNGQDDMVARVSIVNKVGEVLLDKHVKPRQPVIDYRTSVSGIRPHDIENGEDFESVQDEVVKLLQGKILVGHALRSDLAVLHIKHPFANVRDTARYKPLSRLVSNGHTPSLKRLTLAVLGQEIQTGEHNSVEDARAAMGIYNRIATDWEKYLEKRQHK